MSLQFDPSIYERIAERKQQQDQQGRQQVAQAVESVPQALLAYGQQKQQLAQQGRQNRLSDLTTGIALQNAGGDPNAGLAYLNGTGIAQPSQDTTSKMSQLMQSPGPWSNPEPEGTPSASTGGSYATPPTPMLDQGRGVLDHWDQQNPHLHSSTTLGDVFNKGGFDIDTAIKKRVAGDPSAWNALPPSIQKTAISDPMYKDSLKPHDNLNFSQAKLIVPTLDKASFDVAYPSGIPREHLAMMSKPTALSTMNTSTYDTAPADDQRLARNLVDGKIRPSDIGYRDRGRIVSLASEFADKSGKDFNSFGGDVNAGMAKNMAYGKMGQNTLSLNTALGHIGDAAKAYQAVGNTNQKWLNTPINVLKRQTNDPNIVALDLALNAVSGEMATTFKSGGATDQEIGHFAHVLTSDLTPAQAQSVLQSAGHLLNSRLNALQNQQSSVRGSNGGQRQLLSQHGSDVMDSLQGGAKPLYANNGKQRIMSTDGGQTWQPAQ